MKISDTCEHGVSRAELCRLCGALPSASSPVQTPCRTIGYTYDQPRERRWCEAHNQLIAKCDPAATPAPVVEQPPSLKMSIQSMARHIAGPIRDYRTDESYNEVVRRATDALNAAAQTLAAKNSPSLA